MTEDEAKSFKAAALDAGLQFLAAKIDNALNGAAEQMDLEPQVGFALFVVNETRDQTDELSQINVHVVSNQCRAKMVESVRLWLAKMDEETRRSSN